MKSNVLFLIFCTIVTSLSTKAMDEKPAGVVIFRWNRDESFCMQAKTTTEPSFVATAIADWIQPIPDFFVYSHGLLTTKKEKTSLKSFLSSEASRQKHSVLKNLFSETIEQLSETQDLNPTFRKFIISYCGCNNRKPGQLKTIFLNNGEQQYYGPQDSKKNFLELSDVIISKMFEIYSGARPKTE